MRKFIIASGLIFCGLGLAGSKVARASEIDCDKARTVDEKAICANYRLGQLDARMATLFEVAKKLVAMGQRGDIQDAQSSWLERRRTCGSDQACLHAAYETRIAQLQKVIDRVASGGPY